MSKINLFSKYLKNASSSYEVTTYIPGAPHYRSIGRNTHSQQK